MSWSVKLHFFPGGLIWNKKQKYHINSQKKHCKMHFTLNLFVYLESCCLAMFYFCFFFLFRGRLQWQALTAKISTFLCHDTWKRRTAWHVTYCEATFWVTSIHMWGKQGKLPSLMSRLRITLSFLKWINSFIPVF